jgi:hypothetical protein
MKRLITQILIFSALSFSGNLIAQEFSLPVPTGEYKVGTTKFYLNDSYREEIFTENQLDNREFMVRAWYPAGNTDDSQPLKYLEGYNIDTLKYFWKMFEIPGKLFDLIGEIKTNSFIDVPVSENLPVYPVLIFSHGYGLGLPELYSFMAEELASNGFIVLSLTHPYESVEINPGDKPPVYLSEERATQMLQENLMEYAEMKKASTYDEKRNASQSVLENSPVANESLSEWVKDAEFLLNQMDSPSSDIPEFLLSKLDRNNIGVLGHSFGGAMGGQLGLNDTRIKAVMNMDGFQYGDLMGKDLNFTYAMVYSDFNKQMNDAILTSTSNDLYFITIAETMHFTFTDMILYPEVFDKMAFTGTIKQEIFVEMINDLIINYFNKYLYKRDMDFPSAVFMNQYKVDVKTMRK